MTHRELCEVGASFLSKSDNSKYKFPFVLMEFVCSSSESPDVFGFNGWSSILIEVKTSRSDFRRDFKKMHRIHPSTGMGERRYFLCLENLIHIDELPEKWGLMYVIDGKVQVVKQSEIFTRNMRSEQGLMYSVIRRNCKSGILDFRKNKP